MSETSISDSSVQVEALKPCPFCNGKGAFVSEHDPDGGGVFYAIQCRSCNARSAQHYVSHGNDCPQFRSEVRSDWNRRAALPVAPSDERIIQATNTAREDVAKQFAVSEITVNETSLEFRRAFARVLLAQAAQPLPVAALSDADRELMQEALKALEKSADNFPANVRHQETIAALRTRLLRHSEGKE